MDHISYAILQNSIFFSCACKLNRVCTECLKTTIFNPYFGLNGLKIPKCGRTTVILPFKSSGLVVFFSTEPDCI